MKYVDVVIDNKSNSTDALFTYKCEDDAVSVGSKVYVPFARSRKPREGYVVSVSEDASRIEEAVLPKLRAVERVDEDVSLTEEMVRSAMWMRGRYLCRYIDAIRCFTPAGSAAVRREKQNSLAGERGFAEQVDQLTGEQEDALSQIIGAIEARKNERFLIHGVTGSGKTEVYIRAAKKALDEGRGVIILVPEISLTGQIIERFLGNFGEDSVAVLHSRLSAGERYDQWKRVRDGKTRIVIGARSAVFAPVENLGLIVVDEEHESTYKSDFTPKYDTIEVAVKRLQDQDSQGVLILGSATPSVVTYSRAQEGIYKLIELTKRYNEAELPKTEIEARAAKALEMVGLDKSYYEKSPFELSGGQKRRVAIAGVLAMQPEVLVLDEPTAGLDPKGRDEILDQVSALHKSQGMTVVLVSHSMEDVARYADRLMVMNAGQKVYDGTPKEVFRHYKELEEIGLSAPQVTYIVQGLRKRGIPVSEDVTTVPEAKAEILKLLGRGTKC